MIRPKRLKVGDKIAIVSLSWGGLGDEAFRHRYEIAKERLENEFNLEVVTMPHALKGTSFIQKHPELRAKDLMDAFQDTSISAIFSAIGGDDSIRLLPYIDYDIIRKNPKIFMGYSDTTITHLMLYKAGITSFYGPAIMSEFGEYVEMMPYSKKAVEEILFADTTALLIESSKEWSDDFVFWDEKNKHLAKKMKAENYGYEVLQGEGKVKGHLLGGCLDVFMMCIGTEIWPDINKWENAILFIETSEDKPSPEFVKWTFRNLAAQGILKKISGIIVGKPQGEVHYEAYKETILEVVSEEEGLSNLAIFYNINIGHAMPTGILPYGIEVELDCELKQIKLLESATQ